MNKRKTGGGYEMLAADYLKRRGYAIAAMNFRCRSGEIDIVARDGSTLVFVEVKYRSGGGFGYPEEAVSARKRKKIIDTARFYLCRFNIRDDIPCRFDMIAIDGTGIRHIRNAFGA